MAEPSTSQNQNHTTTTTTTSWGTLEELLLACAVNRYGTNSWDSIAKELQNRTTLSHFTPHICQQKYRDLKRRFASEARNAVENDAVLWLDELRRLRVAELRRELQRYDLSIVSLQLKVKKLKEESESDNNKNNNKINNVLKKEVEEEEIKDDEKLDLQKNQDKEEKEEEEKMEVKKDEAEGDTWNSAESTRSNLKEKRVNSGEMVESVAESKEGVKESSDVQSTANGSNGNKVKKVGVLSGTSSGGGEENQTQALVEFLEVVRGRKLGSFFERRLLTQETPKYKNLIKQHIDLETIQKRLEEGQYAECQTKFYRDVMLLINNAIIFFTKRSPEHKAALELRQLLTKQFQTHVSLPDDHKPTPSKSTQPAPVPKPTKPEPNIADQTDLKQPKLTITGPVIVCRKRSSISGKSSRGGVGERKETALVTPPSEKLSSLGEKVKQQVEKTSSSSFNAVTKKRTRDQSFVGRSSSGKGNRNPSPSTPISGKGESSEAKVEKKRPSPGNSLSEMRQALGSRSGKCKGTLLLESLKNTDKRKTGNGGNVGNVKSERRKDEGPQNRSGSKLVKEKAKGKGKDERESTLSKEKAKGTEERENIGGRRSNKRPPKRAAAIAAMGKRGRDGGGETELQPKKRQRK